MQRSFLKQISIDKASISTKVKLIRVERRFSESKLTAPIELVKTKNKNKKTKKRRNKMCCSKKVSVNTLQRGFFDQATNKDAKCEYFS